MLQSLIISFFKNTGVMAASKNEFLQPFLDKPIQLDAMKSTFLAFERAIIFINEPLIKAFGTKEVIAVSTFLRVSDNHVADVTNIVFDFLLDVYAVTVDHVVRIQMRVFLRPFVIVFFIFFYYLFDPRFEVFY